MMQKAQAFDVFQLMIAAVIAVAILGILLAIMGQVVIPTQQPIPSINAIMTDSYQYKVPRTTTHEVTFQKGALVPEDQLVDAAGGKSIDFLVGDFGDVITVSGSGDEEFLEPTKQFKSKVTTCCTDAKCFVYLGEVLLNKDCTKKS